MVWIAAKDAMPCRVAFERGKERQVHLLVALRETTGSLLLVENNSIKQGRGLIRVTAPLVGSEVSDRTFIYWFLFSRFQYYVLCVICASRLCFFECLSMF